MKGIGSLLKRAKGAQRVPVTQHLGLRIVRRFHRTPPYEESWHEYLAFEDEHLVGRVTSFEVPLGSKDCWINDLWVEQRHRGRGLGQELLKVTLENAKARGYERILAELTPYDGASPARVEGFFRSSGFEVVPNWESTSRAVAVYIFS
jgi:GNAT superfamily N-acetyltransferase